MKKSILSILTIVVLSFNSISAQEKETPATPEENAISAVKKLIGYIRFKKNDKAIEMVDTKAFSKALLKNHSNVSEADFKEFEESIKEYIIAKSFPIALKYFEKIDINYEKPVIKGKEAIVASSILYQGSEKITFSWVLSEDKGNFLISDFITEGKRVTEVNRTKQIDPLLKKKGMKELISTMKKISK
ncbi:MAG: ABC transporter substrate-binding protein [Leptospira sp.]|nr:ABC transporter substrate-binding protein [Leptospira sp.]